MVLGKFNVDIGPAVAGLGIVGIAVGFGAQSLVKDYFNGVLILVENQFAKGDVVRVAGVSGTVEDFTLRRTTLRDADGVVHSVPNGEIGVASNLTRVWAQINENVSVAYGTDIDRATEVVDDVGRAMAADPDWAGPRPRGAPRRPRRGARRVRRDPEGLRRRPGRGALGRARRVPQAPAGGLPGARHRDAPPTAGRPGVRSRRSVAADRGGAVADPRRARAPPADDEGPSGQ